MQTYMVELWSSVQSHALMAVCILASCVATVQGHADANASSSSITVGMRTHLSNSSQ